MNEEAQFPRQIQQLLEEGTRDISPGALRRLHEARSQALARQRVAVGKLAMAGAGGIAMDMIPSYGRKLLAVAALLVGITSTYYWQEFERAAEHAEIDSALLADEIPFNAYLDQDFLAWLDHLAQNESSSD